MPSALEELPGGAKVTDAHVQVAQVLPDSPAEKAGLLPGDRIMAVNDAAVQKSEEVQAFNQDRAGQTISLTWKREGETLTKSLTLMKSEEGYGIIGISLLDVGLVSYDPLRAVVMGVKLTITLIGQIFLAFGQLIKGLLVERQISADVAGPLGIAVLTGQVAKLGWTYLLQFAALLSVNLAIFNFIPFPALDGGRLLLS